MKNNVCYELKMFSSTLEGNPIIEFEKMNMIFVLKGYDDMDKYHECKIKFNTVIGYQYELAGFAMITDSYDRIVEIEDSDWVKQYENANEEEIKIWKPKHYAIYLDEIGLYQILAQGFEVEEK